MTQFERAFAEMQRLQQHLGAWYTHLNRFLDSVSAQHAKLNQNWNDPRQQEYHKSWVLFEEEQKKYNKIAQSIAQDLIQLHRFMSEYLRRPIQTHEMFRKLNQVRSLSGWPASQRSPIKNTILVKHLDEYMDELEKFRQSLSGHVQKIVRSLQTIKGLIDAPKINTCRDQINAKIRTWITECEQAVHRLLQAIQEIHTHLAKFN